MAKKSSRTKQASYKVSAAPAVVPAETPAAVPAETPAAVPAETPTSERTPVNRGEAFESLLLIAHRWVGLVGSSAPMTDHALSVPAFVVLLAIAEEPGSPVGKLAQKAGLDRAAAVEQSQVLQNLGLIEQTRGPDGKGLVFVATAKGHETLAALRAGFAETAANIPDANWRAVPRVAAVVRVAARLQRKALSSVPTE